MVVSLFNRRTERNCNRSVSRAACSARSGKCWDVPCPGVTRACLCQHLSHCFCESIRERQCAAKHQASHCSLRLSTACSARSHLPQRQTVESKKRHSPWLGVSDRRKC